MKVCFLLQRKFAYVGHKMAKIMQEKYGVNEFCGYVMTRTSYRFLKNQTEINYSSLLLDEDINKAYHQQELDLDYLKILEVETGRPFLWPYLLVDRIIMSNQLVREYPYDRPRYSHEEMMRLVQVHAKAIIAFLEKEKPDVLIGTVFGSLGTNLLYHLARQKGIKVITIMAARIGDNYTVTEDYCTLTYVEKKIDKLIKENKNSQKIDAARKFIHQFRQKPTTYLYHLKDGGPQDDRIKQLEWFLPKNFLHSLKWFIKLCFKTLRGQQNDYSDERPFGFLIDRIKRKTRSIRGYKKLYDSVNLNEDFVLYPLQMEPEISTLLYAPYWTDQKHLAKQIARSLPLNYKLYVKEHRTMIGRRPYGFYKELKKTPNIKLINPNYDTFKLIKYCKLIAVITASVGWEGILFKKPVITFGEVFFNKLSTVEKCETISQLPYLIKKQLNSFKYNDNEIENFIGVLLEESVEAKLAQIWHTYVPGAEVKRRLTLLVDLLAKKLNLTPII